jgi:hypothetical protein
VDDVRPPSIRLLTGVVRRPGPIRLLLTDGGGSGVDPASRSVTIDGRGRPSTVAGRVLRIPTESLRPGRHVLRVRVSDYQETQNTENVARILPNTRTLRVTFLLR